VKRKSAARLQSELWNELRPEIDSAALISEITELLHKLLGESTRNVNVAHNLATYLMGKYSVSPRKKGALNWLIALHANDLKEFLSASSIKDLLSFLKTRGQLPKPKKKPRRKAITQTERMQRRKKSKNRYEQRRREYREGLIIKQFGKFPRFQALDPHSRTSPEGPCLDLLFSGGAIRKAGHWDSLENLFDVDRHRFPKSLSHKRRGSNVVYSLDAFVQCLIHLLANRDGGKQWLPELSTTESRCRIYFTAGGPLRPSLDTRLPFPNHKPRANHCFVFPGASEATILESGNGLRRM
jgi:phenylpyruvate tautomerase PptA (4-oxalocrotonate tautomerase family)